MRWYLRTFPTAQRRSVSPPGSSFRTKMPDHSETVGSNVSISSTRQTAARSKNISPTGISAPANFLGLPIMDPVDTPAHFTHLGSQDTKISITGVLIINADDWGRSQETTDRIAECVAHGAVSSVSAMVFMEDSERSAVIARERGIDAGLHLNFTT